MKTSLLIEHHPSEQSAKDWKALWDDVKFDEKKKQWYLQMNKKRHDNYFIWLDSYIKEIEAINNE